MFTIRKHIKLVLLSAVNSCLIFQKSLQPPLPGDLALSFYVQSHKLVFAVYHILSKEKEAQGPPKFDVFQVRKLFMSGAVAKGPQI